MNEAGFRYCPECGAEYRPGFKRCYDCDVELVDELPPEPEEIEFDPAAVPRLVQVFAASRMEADAVRAALEGHGIPAIIAKEGNSAAYPLNVGGLGEGRVLVTEDRGQEALEVIGSFEEEDEVDETPEVLAAPRSADPLWFIAALVVAILVLTLILGVLPGPN